MQMTKTGYLCPSVSSACYWLTLSFGVPAKDGLELGWTTWSHSRPHGPSGHLGLDSLFHPTQAYLEQNLLPRVKISHSAADHVPLTTDPDLCILTLREDSCGFFSLWVYV